MNEVTVDFPGTTKVECYAHNHTIENFEYAASALLLNIGKLPEDAILYIDNVEVYDKAGTLLSTEDFENATVAEFEKTNTVYYPGWQYGAIFEIADENATYISSVELADRDFTQPGATPIGGWNSKDEKNFNSKIQDDGTGVKVDVITFTKQNESYEVQVNFENVYPKDAKIRLTMEAKGSVAGSIYAGLQNPNNYQGCGNFGEIVLTTDYQIFKKTVLCSRDNARRLLLNVGTYNGSIYIKSVKIEALEVPEETVTISPSGYSTYAAYYPVDYSKINGLKAYKVTLKGDKTGIEMEEVKDVVPAGVAVLLKGTANTPYALPKAEGWGWAEPSGLKMSDGNATSTDAATLYALATKDGVTAFYPVKKDSPIPAKRCYLEVNGTSQNAAFYSLGTNFGETTGISSVENKVEKADAPVYNLAGQLVGKDYKGLVIKNGKKFVIK